MSGDIHEEFAKAYEAAWFVTTPNGTRRPLAMRDVAEAVALASTPDEVVQMLMSVGLPQKSAVAAILMFRECNKLETEGVWSGVTTRQRTLARIDAANKIDCGTSPEQAEAELIAEGYSVAQASEVVQAHVAQGRAAAKSGAPAMIVVGALITGLGVIATLASAAIKTSHHRIYIGAILCGIVMMVIGAFRRLK